MNSKKRKKILFVIIIAVILFATVLVIRNVVTKKQEETKPLNSVEDLKTPQDVIRYVGGEYIGQKESTDSDFSLDIYAKFSKDLYTGDTSNEDYYRRIVRLMAYTLNFDSFRIADEEKKILVAVVCDKDNSKIERTYINGYDNYFARQDSEIEYAKISNTKVTNFNVQSPELAQLISNNWSKNTLNLQNGTEFDEYTIYQDTGIAVKNAYKNVFNIVFRYNYFGNVVNGINPTMELEDVINILGQPTFDGKDIAGVIGYKGSNIYVFFSYGQISVYPIIDYSTSTLISNIKKFNEDGDVKKFVSSITDTWKDYNLYNYGEEFVDLQYALKGIKIQFNVTNQHGIIVYNNFSNIDELKNLQEELDIQEIYFVNEDAVYDIELSKITNIRG